MLSYGNLAIATISLLLLFGTACKAQDASSALASVGAQIQHVVESQFVVDDTSMEPTSGKPLAVDGKWLAANDAPSACPKSTDTCIDLVYTTPGTRVSCRWTVLLTGDGTSGQVLAENDDAAHYFLPRLNSLDTDELIISRSEPAYPADEAAKAREGTLVVQLRVGADGHVEQVRTVGGYLVNKKRLVAAAEDAVKTWLYKPYRIGPRPVAFQTTVTFHVNSPESRTKKTLSNQESATTLGPKTSIGGNLFCSPGHPIACSAM